MILQIVPAIYKIALQSIRQKTIVEPLVSVLFVSQKEKIMNRYQDLYRKFLGVAFIVGPPQKSSGRFLFGRDD